MVDLEAFGEEERKMIHGKACWEGEAMVQIPERLPCRLEKRGLCDMLSMAKIRS